MPLVPGLSGRATLTVTGDDSAIAFRSGSVEVLATPRLVALCEEATLDAIRNEMTDQTTSVGMRVHLDHLSPSAIGVEVVATAELERIDGRRLTFTVTAQDQDVTVAQGQVIRVVVETERFLERLG